MDKNTFETYSKSADRMAEKFRGLGARVADIERAFSFVKKENPNVLELGCGDGRDAREILKHTNRYLGVDISPAFIKLAEVHAPNGQFSVADLETFEFPPNLDIIFAFASLLHTPKDVMPGIFERAHTALNANGIFYISMKESDAYQEITKTDDFGTRTYYHYPITDFIALAGNGYHVEYSDHQDFLNQRWFTLALRKI